jgi:hypothetical protein
VLLRRLQIAGVALAVAVTMLPSGTATALRGGLSDARSRTVVAMNLSPERSLQMITMVSPVVGYGLFESSVNSTASVCRAWVARTVNRGRIFGRPVAVHTWAHCQNVGFPERIAANALGDVFVWGNGLFESHDSGSAWIQSSPGGTVEDVSPRGASVWLASEACHSSDALTCPVILDLSANGGRSWTRDSAQPPGVIAQTGPQTSTTTILLRVTPSVGYVFSGPRSLIHESRVQPVWQTMNGGKTWHSRHTRCATGPIYGIPYASATSKGAIFLLCTNEPFGGLQYKSTSVSYNGARTWRIVNPQSKLSDELTNGYASSLAAVSDTTAFVTGEQSNLLVTRNAGKSWTALPLGGEAGNPQQVLFVNPTDGFMLASSPTSSEWIYYTVNAGSTWIRLAPAF